MVHPREFSNSELCVAAGLQCLLNTGQILFGRDVPIHFRAKGENGPIRLGVIGLGAGVTAALAREEDTLHYYEINPNVFDIATEWFDFWEACPADKDIFFGDGRLTLEGLPNENLDVLVIDRVPQLGSRVAYL